MKRVNSSSDTTFFTLCFKHLRAFLSDPLNYTVGLFKGMKYFIFLTELIDWKIACPPQQMFFPTLFGNLLPLQTAYKSQITVHGNIKTHEAIQYTYSGRHAGTIVLMSPCPELPLMLH